VIQRREQACLAFKSRQPIGIAREQRRQELDRDIPPKLGIPGTIDLAHAADAEQSLDEISADGAADHRRWCEVGRSGRIRQRRLGKEPIRGILIQQRFDVLS